MTIPPRLNWSTFPEGEDGVQTGIEKIWVSTWATRCLGALWAFSILHGQPSGMGGGGRWGSAGISTLSFPELNPSEVGGAKSNCCRHFCWMGAALRGEGAGPWGVGTCRGPCKSSTGSGFMCFLVALGTALDLISAEPTFAEPFVNHLTPAQTCWEHQSHLPDHNVPSFSFFPSFLSLLLQPTYIIWAWQGGKR